MDLMSKVEHNLYAYLVGRQMTCPVNGKVLDISTAVVVEETDGIKTLGIFSPEGWESIKDGVISGLPTCRIVIDGKVQNRMKIKVENSYSDGHESQHIVEFVNEPSLEEIGPEHDYGDGDNWWWSVVYEFTGDGHGDGSSGRLHSSYTATIVEAANPELIGLSYDWID